MPTPKKISIVVPFHNEEQNVPVLYQEIVEVMAGITPDYEMVFVDDKSTDRTADVLLDLVRRDPRVVCVKLRRNHGQTGALAAGFDYAAGAFVIPMDGDLQHDPADIPDMLHFVMDGDYDIASGWRKERIDPFLSRKLPSRVANWLMAKLSGLHIHDFGTTFKVYRREILENINLYGDLHRFIPALALAYGARIVEVPITSRKRKYGKSHYNLKRTFRVFFDLITIRFISRYLQRPIHFFGVPGLICFGGGGGIGLFLLLKKIMSGSDIFARHAPLMLLSVLLVLAGVQLISFGLLAELLTRIYFESAGKTIYALDRVIRHEDLNGDLDEDLSNDLGKSARPNGEGSAADSVPNATKHPLTETR